MGRGADAAGGDPVAAAVAAEKAAAEAATSTPSPPSSSSRDWHFLPYPVGHRKRASFVRHYETLLAARADAAARHAYVPSVRAALDGDGFASLRRLNVLTFDPAAHPVLRAFRALIGVADDADLSRAHLSFRDFSRRSSHLDDKASLLAPLARDSPARDAFVDAYDALVLAVVAPAVAAAMGPELEDAILYAAFPCVRVQQPCEQCVVSRSHGCWTGRSGRWPLASGRKKRKKILRRGGWSSTRPWEHPTDVLSLSGLG